MKLKVLLLPVFYRDGPADLAGLVPGDIILSIDSKKINSGQDGLLKVANLEPGKAISMKILRNGKTIQAMPLVGHSPCHSIKNK